VKTHWGISSVQGILYISKYLFSKWEATAKIHWTIDRSENPLGNLNCVGNFIPFKISYFLNGRQMQKITGQYTGK
jgi:hypothetical protein